MDTVSSKIVALKEANDSSASSVAVSPDGELAAVGMGDPDDRNKECDVVLWNTASRKTAATLQGHKGPVRSVAFSGDGSVLATAGMDGVIRLWEINHQEKP